MIFFFAKIYEKEEHADAFIRGSLFANSLRYFKRIENRDGRGDKYEGAIIPRLDGLSITLTCTDIETGEVSEITIPEEDFAAPPIIQPTRLDHFNVFCMYAGYSGAFKEISTDNLQCFQKQLEIPEECTKLGRYAVLIKNVTEFIKRVRVAAERENYEIWWRLLRYYDPEVGTPRLESSLDSIFSKSKEYEYQREFRFAIDNGSVGRNHIILDIGEIDDITMCMDSREINRQIDIRIKRP